MLTSYLLKGKPFEKLAQWKRTVMKDDKDGKDILYISPEILGMSETSVFFCACCDGETVASEGNGKHCYFSIDWFINEYPKHKDDLLKFKENTIKSLKLIDQGVNE